MGAMEKLQSLIILGAVGLGLLLGQIQSLQIYAEHLILPFLMIMLFGVFLQIPVQDIKNSFKNIRFTSISVIINFIWTPVLAWLLGYLFLSDSPELWIGFLMLMVTPCTDWYLIFTGIARGNVALGTALLPLNFILQLILLPLYLLIFAGALVQIDLSSLVQGVLLVLVAPLLAANLFRRIVQKLKGNAWLEDKILAKIGFNQILFLSLAIGAMFASQGKVLLDNPQLMLKMLIPVLIFFALNFIIGQVISRLFRFTYEDTVALNLTTLARNSPIALAIAVATFPHQPLIALALIIGPLIELPVLALIAQILLNSKKIQYSEDKTL